MDTVGQLDQDHPDVLNHRQEHLAKRLGLPSLRGVVAQPPDLGHAIDAPGDLGTECPFQLLDRDCGVFHRIVQQADDECHAVEMHVSQKVGHFKQVAQIGLAGPSLLTRVILGGEIESAPQQAGIFPGPMLQQLSREFVVAPVEVRCRTWAPGRRIAGGGHGWDRLALGSGLRR